MARHSKSPYPKIDLETAAGHIFRLLRVVGVDSFTRKDAAEFLGWKPIDPRFASDIFPALRLFGLIDRQQQGRKISYRVSEGGQLLALHILQSNPGIAEEPMTLAGQAYLDRRLAEISAELEEDVDAPTPPPADAEPSE